MEDVPCEVEIEEQLLGAMLTEAEKVVPIVRSLLGKNDFYKREHQLIYQAIVEMDKNGDRIEPSTVGSCLKGKSVSATHLAGLIKTVTSTEPEVILAYVRRVKEASAIRELSRVDSTIKKAVREGKSSTDIINLIEGDVDKVRADIKLDEFKYDADVFDSICKGLDKRMDRYEKGKKISGLETGFPLLDKNISGLEVGLHVLGGAPYAGKTGISKQIGDQVVIINKIPVIFVSYEQSRDELAIKALSRLAEIDSRVLLDGSIKEKCPEKVKTLKEKEKEYREKYAPYIATIEADDKTDLTRIETYARRVIKEYDYKNTEYHKNKCLIIIDYLQVIPHKEDFKDMRLKVNAILSKLARMARRLNSPIWVISSFSREAYGARARDKTSEELDMTAWKESGSIEYSADVAIRMFTDEIEQNEDIRTVDLRIVKKRMGRKKKIVFRFNAPLSKFEDIDEEDLRS